MGSKKSGRNLGIRFPEELLTTVEEVAAMYHLAPSTLARALLEEFVAEVKNHGTAVMWPPKFHVVTATTVPGGSEAGAAGPKSTVSRFTRSTPVGGRAAAAVAAAATRIRGS